MKLIFAEARFVHRCAFCDIDDLDRAERHEEHLNRCHPEKTVDQRPWAYVCTNITKGLQCSGQFSTWSGFTNHAKAYHKVYPVMAKNRNEGEKHRAKFRILLTKQEFDEIKRFNKNTAKPISKSAAIRQFKSHKIQQPVTTVARTFRPPGLGDNELGYEPQDYSTNGIVTAKVSELEDPDLSEWVTVEGESSESKSVTVEEEVSEAKTSTTDFERILLPTNRQTFEYPIYHLKFTSTTTTEFEVEYPQPSEQEIGNRKLRKAAVVTSWLKSGKSAQEMLVLYRTAVRNRIECFL